jgi:hypothetical protein
VFFYSAYGRMIASSFPLPELLPYPHDATRTPDILIREGQVPETLEAPEAKGVVYEAKPNTFLLKLDRVAKYLVEDGKQITVEPAAGSLESDIRVFLLGSCVGALLHQRGVLALHASALETPRGAVLFMGDSGVGKSTTLQAFIRRGYNMLADDITGVVLSDTGQAAALPAFPRTKLWQDAAERFEIDTAHLERVRPQLEKFELHLHDFYQAQPLTLYKVYLLSSHNKPDITLHPLAKPKQFQTLLNNTYRAKFLGGLSMRHEHFKLAIAVANQVTISRLYRPSYPVKLDELVSVLETDFSAPESDTQRNPTLEVQ